MFYWLVVGCTMLLGIVLFYFTNLRNEPGRRVDGARRDEQDP